MSSPHEVSGRLLDQRVRNRVMESLSILASGDNGVRSCGNAEFVNQFFDWVDDGISPAWRNTSTLTAEEVEALDLVQQVLLEACAATPKVMGDEDFIASGWPDQIKRLAVAALVLMCQRGRHDEDTEEADPPPRIDVRPG